MTSKEALDRLVNTLIAEGYWQDVLQDVAVIEQDLEVLDIIIKKKVNIAYFYQFISEYRDASYEQYLELRKMNGVVFAISQKEILTEDEYNKIKEKLEK